MRELSAAAIELIRQLVEDIVEGNFSSIELNGWIGRLTREEIVGAINEYGRTLVSVPDKMLEDAEVYRSDHDQRQFAVDVPLWTREEGRSDLTLSLTVFDSNGEVSVSIDDLHVL